MVVRKISLVNFRNYNKLNVSLNEKVNIFIGNNAQGKTNILESIYFLAITKSYRTTYDNNLIKKGTLTTKVKGEVTSDEGFKSMTIELSGTGKKVSINNNPLKKISDYITNLNVIIVSPEDINIIKGTPSERRNFLNIELSQMSGNYLKRYNEFNKLLKIRNDYLKMLYKNANSDERYLESITENLIEREIYIYKERKKFIDYINNRLPEIYRNISGIDKLSISYQTNIDLSDFEDETIRKVLHDKYLKSRKKELENGMTLYGPHRDEFQFLIDDVDIKIYGSQGQQKMAIVALKLSEINIFKEITGSMPILLLDDIFSELDKTNRNKMIKYITGDMQVIITTNDIRGISKKLLDNALIYEVVDAKLIEKGEKNNGK